jgi:hypothetical protein
MGNASTDDIKNGNMEKKIGWWKLMWKNSYIQLFAVAIVFLSLAIWHKDSFYTDAGFYIAASIPTSMMIIISYYGFYKFWREYSRNP